MPAEGKKVAAEVRESGSESCRDSNEDPTTGNKNSSDGPREVEEIPNSRLRSASYLFSQVESQPKSP